jgi:tetratricopeptide (TPR) repeat protein
MGKALKSTLQLSLACAAVLFLVPTSGAQTNPELPPTAKAAFEKGLLAAQQQNYGLAIRYFNEARRTAPESAPEILFNLGLAESKLSGRELRAIAWFQAYLVANPKAANVSGVEQEIKTLEIRVESTMGKLAEMASQIARQLPNPSENDLGDKAFDQRRIRGSALPCAAKAQALYGDTAGALKTAGLAQLGSIPGWDDDQYLVLIQIVTAQLETGDIAGAQQTAAQISGADDRSRALQSIADAQAKAGNIAGAQQTAAQISGADDRSRALQSIADAQAKVAKERVPAADTETIDSMIRDWTL